jgi:hypothetical protein
MKHPYRQAATRRLRPATEILDLAAAIDGITNPKPLDFPGWDTLDVTGWDRFGLQE